MVVCSGFSIQFRTQNPHPVCLLKFQGEGPLNTKMYPDPGISFKTGPLLVPLLQQVLSQFGLNSPTCTGADEVQLKRATQS